MAQTPLSKTDLSTDLSSEDEPPLKKVALVHDWLTGMRGGEKCLFAFCKLFPEAELSTLLWKKGTTVPLIEQRKIHASFLQWFPGVFSYYRYLLPLMPTAVEWLRIPKTADLVLSSSHAVAKSVVVPEGIPHVCYCHTPIRYAWEMRKDYFGKRGKRRHEPRRKRLENILYDSPLHRLRDFILNRIQRWDKKTSSRVTHFIANSRTVAHRIETYYERTAEVIHPPVDTEFYTLPADTTLKEDFYLVVSALVPYKRVDLAVQACAKLKKRLIVVGKGPELKRLKKLATADITFLGWQSDEKIRHLMQRAKALLFPGKEDFGIVPVEAQSCGTPVLAFGEGGATETVIPLTEKKGRKEEKYSKNRMVSDQNQAESHIEEPKTTPKPSHYLASGGLSFPLDDSPPTGIFFPKQTPASLIKAINKFEVVQDRFKPDDLNRHAAQFSKEQFLKEIHSYLQQVVKQRPSQNNTTGTKL
ncbi:MAG: glycosyltransferase [Pirellulaceae bacterium]|nr:glycosyltransferase [Pirellulaceae bacterium]